MARESWSYQEIDTRSWSHPKQEISSRHVVNMTLCLICLSSFALGGGRQEAVIRLGGKAKNWLSWLGSSLPSASSSFIVVIAHYHTNSFYVKTWPISCDWTILNPLLKYWSDFNKCCTGGSGVGKYWNVCEGRIQDWEFLSSSPNIEIFLTFNLKLFKISTFLKLPWRWWPMFGI